MGDRLSGNDRRGPAPVPVVRCAMYTRKSTEEGLEQEFNSLDAQREAAEAYIRSQRHQGWTLIPERYDDGGFSGGNLDRPALQRKGKWVGGMPVLGYDIAACSATCVTGRWPTRTRPRMDAGTGITCAAARITEDEWGVRRGPYRRVPSRTRWCSNCGRGWAARRDSRGREKSGIWYVAWWSG